jgi:hypothetical protein
MAAVHIVKCVGSAPHSSIPVCAVCLLCSLQTATIRILIGMAMAALQNFSTGLEPDLALLNGSSSSSSEAAPSQAQQQQQELTPEMRTALVFRSQRKQLLVDVISVLAEKLKQVGRKQAVMLSLLVLQLVARDACCMQLSHSGESCASALASP